MPKVDVNINEDNILEWIHSVGYFLPRTDQEDYRFEKLHGNITHSISSDLVDPVAILNGAWKPKRLINLINEELNNEVSALRMAARKHEDIPDEIFRKMMQNQDRKDESDNNEN